MEENIKKNPYAEMSEKPEKAETIEITIDSIKGAEAENEEAIEPNCSYAECRNHDGFCDICDRQCNGIIDLDPYKSQVMGECKMCVKMNGRQAKGKNNEKVFAKPVVFHITKREAYSLIEENKVAYIEINTNAIKQSGNLIKIFFGVKDEEEE